MLKKGLKAEIEASKILHSHYLPLLISSQILRVRNCGQVDLACFKDNEIYIFEVKNRKIAKGFLGIKQRIRLSQSVNYISNVFKKRVRLRVWEF